MTELKITSQQLSNLLEKEVNTLIFDKWKFQTLITQLLHKFHRTKNRNIAKIINIKTDVYICMHVFLQKFGSFGDFPNPYR